MLCLSLKGQRRNSDWNLVRETCVKRLCRGSWDFPGLCGEGFRGADFGFTLLPASLLPTGNLPETEGKDLGGGQGGGGGAVLTSQPPGTQDREKGTEYVWI